MKVVEITDSGSLTHTAKKENLSLLCLFRRKKIFHNLILYFDARNKCLKFCFYISTQESV